MQIDELRERVRRLDALLSSPQPGLVSWCLMLGSQMEELIARWNDESNDGGVEVGMSPVVNWRHTEKMP